MKMVYTRCLALAFLLGDVVVAHNWLIYPEPRIGSNDAHTAFGGSSLVLGNCENNDTSIPDGNSFKRGQRIDALHIYNNHYSGFTRFSIVPMGEETDVEAVNDPKNFMRIACHTNNCGGRIHDMNTPDYDYFAPYNLPKQSGIPLDFSSKDNACHTGITFPAHLDDGEYVLSWVAYGMRGSFSDHPEAMALPFYRNCANVKIAGGAELTQKPRGRAAKCAFEWSGGDRTLSETSNVQDIQPTDLDNSQCSYWRYNSINATSNYYSPPNFWAMGPEGLPEVDVTAMRAGPPAEVLACGRRMKNLLSFNDTSSPLPSTSADSGNLLNFSAVETASSTTSTAQAMEIEQTQSAGLGYRAAKRHGRKRRQGLTDSTHG